MLWISLLFLSAIASANPQTLPAKFPAAQPASLRQTANEKPFHSVSDQDVLSASCRREMPFSSQEMTEWLNRQSKAAGPSTSSRTAILGLELVDESPYLAKLLETLLTNEKWSTEPQQTYASPCTKVLCVTQELFGERVGLQLLFMLGRFGFNGSHLRIKNADPWQSDELDSVLLTLSDLPAHLVTNSPLEFNHQLAHYKRNEDSSDRPAANAMIFLFNGWSRATANSQRYILFHELGHDTTSNSSLDVSPAWFRVTGWKEIDLEWILTTPETAISQYAETNPSEDFAESFAAYRYNPQTLKTQSPKVYQFLKSKVFQNLEYTSEKACRQQ
jgi:hypothetical protein